MVAICAIDAANSTPVEPAADQHEGHLPCALARIIRQFRRLVGAENLSPDCLRIGEGLQTGGILGELVMAKITRSHPGGEHQIVERDLSHAEAGAVDLDGPGVQIHAGNFSHHNGKVLLLLCELADWCSHFRRCQNGRRNLIEKGLEDVVIAPIDQNDFRIAPPQRSRGRYPGEAPADNHDAPRLVS
jgi:hypothetical protein